MSKFQQPVDIGDRGIKNRGMRPKFQLPVCPRSAGVLMHVTSLPGAHGIGDLGPVAFEWIDLLAGAGQTWWQILPLGPTGAGHSPYYCFSAFAGNPLLISLDALVKDGLLTRSDLAPANQPAGEVDYPRVSQIKYALLADAYARFTKHGGKLATAFARFQKEQRAWLADFSLFIALRGAHADARWTDWPADLVARKRAALVAAKKQLSHEIGRASFFQFLFFRQLAVLRDHARKRGVKLIGDLPIFVSDQSADVWANRKFFELDRHGRQLAGAGVPPDLFAKTGQYWGNPLYQWRAMKRDGYRWWIARLASALGQADLVRLDHFRGFDAFWRIPAGSKTAKAGKWVKGPGDDLFNAFRDHFGGLPVIAEDLGLITPSVEALRDRFDLPGMRVLQFAFDGDPANPHLPHNCPANSVIYTGTHDNDTTAGWLAGLDAKTKRLVSQYATPDKSADSAWPLIQMAWASSSRLAIAPAQDLLSLDRRSRMNTPGIDQGNWRWRLDSFEVLKPAFARLRELTERYNRMPA